MSEKRRHFSLAQLFLLTMLGAGLCTYYSAVLRTSLEHYHIWKIVISPRGGWLARASTRGLVVFNLQTGTTWLKIKDARNPAFSRNEQRVAFEQKGRIEVWELHSRKLVKSWSNEDVHLRSLAFTADGTLVIDRYGNIERWSLPAAKHTGSASIRDGFAHAIGGSSDMSFIAVGNSRYPGYDVEIWDCRSSTLAQTMSGSEYTSIHDLAFSPDDATIAAAMSDGIRLWDRESGDLQSRLHVPEVCSVAFSSTGDLVASVDSSGNVRVWSVSSDEVSIIERLGKGWHNSVQFAGSDQKLVASGENGTAKIMNLDGRGAVRRFSGLHLPPPTATMLWYVTIVAAIVWLILWYRIKPRRDDSTTKHHKGDYGWHLVLVTAIVTSAIALPFLGSTSYLNPAMILLIVGCPVLMLLATLASLVKIRYNVLCLTFSLSAYVAVCVVGCWLFGLAVMHWAG